MTFVRHLTGKRSQSLKAAASICLSLNLILAFGAFGIDGNAARARIASPSSEQDQSQPQGTLLLPMVGRMGPAPKPAAKPLPATPARTATRPVQVSATTGRKLQAEMPHVDSNQDQAKAQTAQQANDPANKPVTDHSADAPNISAEIGVDDGPEMVDENSLLKGTVQITADDTEFDQEKNTFLGTGNAVALIAGQDSKLEADSILYDQNNGMIDARGNVKIIRSGQLTTGASFKFKLNSDEYMITDPDTELQGTTVVARSAKGSRSGVMFRNGTFTLPQTVHIMNNAQYGPQSTSERVADEMAHPDAFATSKPSFKFKARKMVYEKYKDNGNLTIYGGKLQFNNFTVPLTKFTATVGGDNSRVTFPVTPIVGNNLFVGGINVGPSFNYAVGKTGAFSWAPLLQFGGKTLDGSTVNSKGGVGGGFRMGYVNDYFATHLCYGSNTNLMVGDLKYKFRSNKNLVFQSGINRFMSDGLFGNRRARLLAEVVHTKTISSVPYLSMVMFRTNAGWAQDSPALVNLQGNQYSQLFSQSGKNTKVGAYRLQEQIMANTHPIFSIGNSKYGANATLFGGVAARAYSTGDSMLMGQVGPQMTVRLNRFRLITGYAQSSVRGKSPFVFDEFIQGAQSGYFGGDVKVNSWLTLGGNLGYNINSKMLYNKSMTAAIGPNDFKVLLSREFISGYNRMGFDLLYGQPVQFNKMVVKGAADAGQLGGI